MKNNQTNSQTDAIMPLLAARIKSGSVLLQFLGIVFLNLFGFTALGWLVGKDPSLSKDYGNLLFAAVIFISPGVFLLRRGRNKRNPMNNKVYVAYVQYPEQIVWVYNKLETTSRHNIHLFNATGQSLIISVPAIASEKFVKLIQMRCPNVISGYDPIRKKLYEKSPMQFKLAMEVYVKETDPEPKPIQGYRSLLEAAKSSPQSADFKIIRKALVESSEYDPYGRSNQQAYAAFDLFTAGKTAQAVQAFQACLDRYYLDSAAHSVAASIYGQLGEYQKATFHNYFEKGLLQSILSSGDGKTFETAYRVIDLPEEYSVLSSLGVTKYDRRTVVNAGCRFDVFQVEYKNESQYEVYFNVDFSKPVPPAPSPPAHDLSEDYIPAVRIGNQEWMAGNLNSEKFRNGDAIAEAASEEEWVKAGREGKPAWCFYDNNSEFGMKYGKLYNWYAVSDPRGLLPEGWKLPSVNDWLQLMEHMGGKDVSGIRLKSISGWDNNGYGSNESGFNGLPGGGRIFEKETSSFTGMFSGMGQVGNWWSADEKDNEHVWVYSLVFMSPGVSKLGFRKEAGMSLRGIKINQ